MNQETKNLLADQLVKRIKSFLWRTLMLGVALFVQFGIDNLTQFQLSPQVTVLIGLVLGEISKWINTGLPSSTAKSGA